MAQNFTKTLETVSPSISIVEKQYDTSMASAAQSIADVIKGYAERKAAERDAETAGNFYEDLNAASYNIEKLRDYSEQDRLKALEARNTDPALYDEDPSNDADVLKTFNREIERINLKEQQQGIVLDSAKRALVRKWTNVRPDLTEFFTKGLALDEKIGKMRSEAANYASQQMTEWQKTYQTSLANGTTVAIEQSRARWLAKAQEVEARLSIASDSGKLGQVDFNESLRTTVNAELGNVNATIYPLTQRAMAGDSAAITNIRDKITQARLRIDNGLLAGQMKWQQETGQIIDTTPLKELSNNYLDNLEQIITYQDQRAASEVRNMANDEALFNLLHSYMPWIDRLLIPEIGVATYSKIIQGAATHQKNLKERFATLAVGEAAGNPQAQEAISFLRIHSEQLAQAMMGHPLGQNTEAVQIMNALIGLLQRGQVIPPELAAKANPIINEVLFSTISSGTLTPQQQRNATSGLIRNTVDSYDSFWGQGNIFNAGSVGAKAMQALAQNEWELAVQPIATELQTVVSQIPENELPAFTFDPNKEEPFAYDANVMRSVRGRFDAPTYFVDAITELNKYYKMLTTTRTNGKPAANMWATDYMAKNGLGNVQPQQTQAPTPTTVETPSATGQAAPAPDGVDEADFYARPR